MTCPNCTDPTGMLERSPLFPLLTRLVLEYDHSVRKHGDWSDYDTTLMLEKCREEYHEVEKAIAAGDMHGPHGAIMESIQAANCHLKMAAELIRRLKEGK